ncbi:uncharacterized protein [Diadema setosum]|uniref:uncharacterized protein n=1 Tax=Diadema setosum TaxID=31175 RepID=UPI003B3AEA9E
MAAANVSSTLDQAIVVSKAESSAGHDHSSMKGEILSKSLPEMKIGDEKKLTSGRSVSSKGKSVKSEKLMKAFQAELDVMDKEDQIEILQREHEHAVKMQKAKMELKRLKIKKQLEQKLSELDESDEDDNLTETSRSSNILLPRESREESVQRFFNSQPVDDVEDKSVNPVVPEVGQAKPVTQDTATSSGMEKVAESLARVANMIIQQNMTSQSIAVSSQLPKLEVPVFSGVADNHRVKECTQRRSCKECKGSHLTCLHLSTKTESPQTSNPQPSEEVSSKCTNVCSLPDQDGREHCMIVPVWVRHSDNPSREYLQYAILDDQSNVGFVSEGLCAKLQLQGQETELQLTTMHQSARVKSKKVTGLQVMDFNREQVIDLPACFSRKEVPASRHQIPKAEVLRKWPHLEPVASQLMPYNKSIEVSLLIGNNCTRAIRPREVLAGGDDDPYAMRTILGWGVVGRVCQTPIQDDHGATCHKMQVSESYPNFTYDTRAKEVFSPDQVLRILEQDFQATNSKGAPLSVEETKFLTILENGIRKRDDGHLEMPLPLKSDQASFPDNKILALKRWKQLAARLHRNPKFLKDYRRFMNRRGAVRQLRSDQGTMFVGARSELREALAEMDQSEVQEYLLQNGCDWIPFQMNVPHASHMGGVWERQIQTVRRVLEPLMKSAGSQLDDEAFRTFMTEAEAIINSRPLTTSGISDPETPEPLTPLHLLTMKPKVALPPPGQFQREDMYARKWWRRVQYLTNQFWLRWRREYLQQLQNRQKWVSPSRQLAVGDVVIAKENDDARGRWPLARVVEVYPSKDGLIRKVKVLMADGLLDNEGKRQRPPSELERPVHKLVLLLPAEQ